MVIGHRNERMETAVRYLSSIGLIDGTDTIKSISEKMDRHPNNVRAAMRGEDKYLTFKFVKTFCSTFGNKISPEWIWDGKGEMVNNTSKEVFSDMANDETRLSKESLMQLNKEDLVNLLFNVVERHYALCNQIKAQNDIILNSSRDITMSIMGFCQNK